MEGTERLMALDEGTGEVLWSQTWPAAYRNIMWKFANGPRTPPTVDGDRVYVLGAAGMLVCLNTETGTVMWQVDIDDLGPKIPWDINLGRRGESNCFADHTVEHFRHPVWGSNFFLVTDHVLKECELIYLLKAALLNGIVGGLGSD